MCDNPHCDVDDRILELYAHSKDLGNVEYTGVKHDGYFPDIEDICSGDDAQMDICMACGKVQGTFPKDHDSIIKAIKESNGEDEDDEIENEYTVDMLNQDILHFVPDLSFTETDVADAYASISESWARFSKAATKYLRPGDPFDDVESFNIFKQLPITLRILGIVRGIEDVRFLDYVHLFIKSNVEWFKL